MENVLNDFWYCTLPCPEISSQFPWKQTPVNHSCRLHFAICKTTEVQRSRASRVIWAMARGNPKKHHFSELVFNFTLATNMMIKEILCPLFYNFCSCGRRNLLMVIVLHVNPLPHINLIFWKTKRINNKQTREISKSNLTVRMLSNISFFESWQNPMSPTFHLLN